MRWPFSLLFRGDRDAPAVAAGPAGGSAAPGGQPAAAPPPRPAAWRGLPAVQRAVGPAPLIAPARPFADALATRQKPDPILRPLAHDVTADGPAGLVSGIATPLAAPPASSAPVHREAAALPVAPAAAGGHGVAQRQAITSSVADLGASRAVAAPSAGTPIPPVRSLPVATVASPALAATRVAESSAPEPARPVARPTVPAVQREVAGAATSAPEIAPDRHRAAAPSGEAPAQLAARAAASGAGTVEAEAPERPPVQRRSLGESRRLGLGAPIPRRPERPAAPPPDLPLARPPAPPARVARAEAAALPVLRLATPAATAVATPAATPTAMPAAPATPPAPAPAPVPESASVSVAPSPIPAGGRPTEASSAGPSGGPAEPEAPAAATRPLVGDVGRRPATPDAATAGEEIGDGPAPAVLPLVARLARGEERIDGPAPGAADAPTTSGSGHAGMRTDAAGTPAPGAIAGGGGTAAASPSVAPLVVARAPLGRPPLRSSVAPEAPAAPAPVIARRAVEAAGGPTAQPSGSPGDPLVQGSPVRLGLSAESMPGGMPTGSPAVALGPAAPLPGVQRSVAATEVRRSPAGTQSLPTPSAVPGDQAGPAATTASSEPAPAPAAAGPGLPLAVARLATAGATAQAGPAQAGPVLGWTPGGGFAAVAGGMPAIQREVAVADPGGATGSVAASGSAGTGEGLAGGPADYEEIAEHVYDRIRARFATELLLDRERMGLLIDG